MSSIASPAERLAAHLRQTSAHSLAYDLLVQPLERLRNGRLTKDELRHYATMFKSRHQAIRPDERESVRACVATAASTCLQQGKSDDFVRCHLRQVMKVIS
jgi:hypothetical protein